MWRGGSAIFPRRIWSPGCHKGNYIPSKCTPAFGMQKFRLSAFSRHFLFSFLLDKIKKCPVERSSPQVLFDFKIWRLSNRFEVKNEKQRDVV